MFLDCSSDKMPTDVTHAVRHTDIYKDRNFQWRAVRLKCHVEILWRIFVSAERMDQPVLQQSSCLLQSSKAYGCFIKCLKIFHALCESTPSRDSRPHPGLSPGPACEQRLCYTKSGAAGFKFFATLHDISVCVVHSSVLPWSLSAINLCL
jgi:hypothetical protein